MNSAPPPRNEAAGSASTEERGDGVTGLDRAGVLEILSGFHSRPVEEIPERIDSMELAWLVHQVEQRYDLRIELSDGQLGRMGTVSGAVDVLREVIETVRNG
jgi:hypothetical protein